MGAPDSRQACSLSGAPPCHPTVRVLEQSTVGIVVFLWHWTLSGVPLTLRSDSVAALFTRQVLLQSTVARR
jgi:hypothetical protein